jgi:hypothetical protein
MDTYRLTAAQDNLTGDYRQVGYISVEGLATNITQIGVLAIITTAAAFAFVALARNLGRLPASFQIGPLEIGIGLVIFVATLVTQEWMHVLVLRHYGARPKLGFFRNNGIFYISIPEYGLRRNSLIVAALAPLVLLTGLPLLAIWLFQGTAWVALFALIAAVNAAASSSDLLMVALLLRYPSTAWIVDDEHGMRVLLPLASASAAMPAFPK